MKPIITASTGMRVVVWKDRDTYCARRADTVTEPEVCLAVDLFEVIAELAGLDLDRDRDANEAVRLAADVQRRLQDDDLEDPSGEFQRRSS